MATKLIEMVMRHEGFRGVVYCDKCGRELVRVEFHWECACTLKHETMGNLTIGYGTRVDGAGISKSEGLALLSQRLYRTQNELGAYPWFITLDDARKDAITDMAYTMGVTDMLEFKLMIAALEAKDWETAAGEIEGSKWASEAPERADEVAAIIESGEMPD